MKGEGKDNTPKFVSVIVITKNNMRTIKSCLVSLLNQEYPREKLEIIFVDGHSSDGTDQLIKKYSKTLPFVKLFYEDFGTMGNARNIGIKNSKGVIIAFTDGDAFPEKSWIEKIVETFSHNPEVDVIGGLDILNIDRASRTIDSWRKLRRNFGKKAISKIRTVNFAIRRDTILACGGFNPELSHFDEAELIARLYFQMQDIGILYDPEIVVFHERGPFSIRARVKKKFVKSSIGVPTLLKKHMLKSALSNLGSPVGSSLLFVFACVSTPLLLSAFFLFEFVTVLSVFLFLGLGIMLAYIVAVKHVTGEFVPGVLFLLILDFFPRFVGTFFGLVKWLTSVFMAQIRSFYQKMKIHR